MSALMSSATVTAVGLTCKAALNLGFCSVTVNGLPTLVAALEHSSRNNGKGVVTVSNHISTLDDPVTWGVLPARYYLHSRMTRWTLGASDILFTNPVFSTFFRLGQTIETFRDKGVHQPAVDLAIAKLNQGDWLHLYGEGQVNPPDTYQRDQNGVAKLPRFKWGVGRIIMETAKPPVIIPMWLTGFDTLMPEGRPFPYKYIPRPGAQLSVTFGEPIPASTIEEALKILGPGKASSSAPHHLRKPEGWIENELADERHSSVLQKDEILRVRAEVTAILQRAVEALGRSVCGDSLWVKSKSAERTD
ncbi:Tafazzin [Hypsizygus marmoreus]|uniref:Tafazzin family protein n=1 Tax=Hypsizygus marmoreus TaxID=39966 RepID=A0A369JL76_HYPMA|nr:Tafazzin [Hypsizygus marmoreus]